MRVAFIGHRTIEKTATLVANLNKIIGEILEKDPYTTFYFGSKSEFDSLCLLTVTKYKIKYPNLKRVYIRTNAPVLSDSYRRYLLQIYDDTYYPKEIEGAGKATYVKRNIYMIDNCDLLITYYRKNYLKYLTKSGTRIAVRYALNKKVKVLNINDFLNY